MGKYLRNIHLLLKYSNLNDLTRIVDSGDKSRVKVIEVVGFSAPMNKIGLTAYLSNNEDSLEVAASEVECGRGIPLYSHALSYQLKHFIKGTKDIKFWRGDN